MTITVFAQIQVKAGESEHLLIALQQLVSATLTEPGCLQYKLHSSLEQADRFWMYERWQSQSALDAHTASDHFQAFITQTAHLVEKIAVDTAREQTQG